MWKFLFLLFTIKPHTIKLQRKMKHLGCWKYVHFAIVVTTTFVTLSNAQERIRKPSDGFPVHSEAKVKLGQMLFFHRHPIEKEKKGWLAAEPT